MGFIVFEEEAFNYLDAQLENFVKRMTESVSAVRTRP